MTNKTKLKYEEPKMSIVIFETKDIITTSGNGFEGELDPMYDEGDPQEHGVW